MIRRGTIQFSGLEVTRSDVGMTFWPLSAGEFRSAVSTKCVLAVSRQVRAIMAAAFANSRASLGVNSIARSSRFVCGVGLPLYPLILSRMLHTRQTYYPEAHFPGSKRSEEPIFPGK